MIEVTYPLNADILRMEGKDLTGISTSFTISYTSEDENTHELVITNSAETEKDCKQYSLRKFFIKLMLTIELKIP